MVRLLSYSDSNAYWATGYVGLVFKVIYSYLDTSCRSSSQTKSFFITQGTSNSPTSSFPSFFPASMASVTKEAENRQITSKIFSSNLLGLSLLEPLTRGTYKKMDF